MIERSFVHLPGIGLSKEKKLWESGIRSWDELRAANLRHSKPDLLYGALSETTRAWEQRDLFFFYEKLPRTELWRLVPGFHDDIAFLDIETTGLALPPSSRSTTITFYFRGVVYQAHEHKAKAELLREMDAQAKIFCSFFGEVFDVPFLRREFDMELKKPHLDLCFWLKRHGFGGGLKKVERLFHDIPHRESLDIGGFDAVRLWSLHERGMKGALETLLHYNAEDTVVLAPLLVKAYNREVEKRPHLELNPLTMPAMPNLKTAVDLNVYRYLRGELRATSVGAEAAPRELAT